MVPWPFTVWATSESSFRWESPDVAAHTENKPQSELLAKKRSIAQESLETQRTLWCQTQARRNRVTEQLGVTLKNKVAKKEISEFGMQGWWRSAFRGRDQGGGLGYISFQHLTIVKRGWYSDTKTLQSSTDLQEERHSGDIVQTLVCICSMLLPTSRDQHLVWAHPRTTRRIRDHRRFRTIYRVTEKIRLSCAVCSQCLERGETCV